MSDLRTMIWKEVRDQILLGGWTPWIRPLILTGVMGVALPLRLGLQWLELTPIVMLILLDIPFLNIIGFIGDAIAGERERHTLETLLASRMPDRAILLGKIIVTVGYTWGMSIAGLLLGAVAANLSNKNGSGQGSWVFYHPLDLLLEALALTLLVSLLAASAGVLISLRVATVRQAQQILIVGTMLFIFGGLLVISALPADLFSSFSYSQILLVAIAVIAILDAILLGISLVTFQRSRLILS